MKQNTIARFENMHEAAQYFCNNMLYWSIFKWPIYPYNRISVPLQKKTLIETSMAFLFYKPSGFFNYFWLPRPKGFGLQEEEGNAGVSVPLQLVKQAAELEADIIHVMGDGHIYILPAKDWIWYNEQKEGRAVKIGPSGDWDIATPIRMHTSIKPF